jgi:hypothetical protein
MELKNGTLGVHNPDNQYQWTLIHSVDEGIMKENIRLREELANNERIRKSNLQTFKENEVIYKNTIAELHTRNHQLIENQSKIEQKARTQQRQHDAKVYAYWKQKAEALASKVFILENEVKKAEGLQEIVSKLMDRLVDRSRKLIAIKRILDGSSEPCSE